MLFSLAVGRDRRQFRPAPGDAGRAGLHARGLGRAGACSPISACITPWLLLAFTFLIGCGTALNNPSWQASVGDMVPRDRPAGGGRAEQLGFNLTRSVGPAIGGAIVAAAGAAAAFAVNAVSYLALIVVLLRWQPVRRAAHAAARDARARDGGRPALRRDVAQHRARCCCAASSSASPRSRSWRCCRWWRAISSRAARCSTACCSAPSASARSAARCSARRLRGSAVQRVDRAHGLRRLCRLRGDRRRSAPSAWLTCSALMIGGACWVLALSLFNVTVQLSTPRWVVGRALSLYQMATFGGMALGSWIWGVVAEALRHRARRCWRRRR